MRDKAQSMTEKPGQNVALWNLKIDILDIVDNGMDR